MDALEKKTKVGSERWHRIIVDGVTQDQAKAEYERENGPIGEDNIMFITIVDR